MTPTPSPQRPRSPILTAGAILMFAFAAGGIALAIMLLIGAFWSPNALQHVCFAIGLAVLSTVFAFGGLGMWLNDASVPAPPKVPPTVPLAADPSIPGAPTPAATEVVQPTDGKDKRPPHGITALLWRAAGAQLAFTVALTVLMLDPIGFEQSGPGQPATTEVYELMDDLSQIELPRAEGTPPREPATDARVPTEAADAPAGAAATGVGEPALTKSLRRTPSMLRPLPTTGRAATAPPRFAPRHAAGGAGPQRPPRQAANQGSGASGRGALVSALILICLHFPVMTPVVAAGLGIFLLTEIWRWQREAAERRRPRSDVRAAHGACYAIVAATLVTAIGFTVVNHAHASTIAGASREAEEAMAMGDAAADRRGAAIMAANDARDARTEQLLICAGLGLIASFGAVIIVSRTPRAAAAPG